MSRELGNRMPADLLELLSGSDSNWFNQVILFTTVDPDGWPRHGMLSPWELVARSSQRLLMRVYTGSRSAQNLEKTSRVSFIVVNAQMSYYMWGRVHQRSTIEEAPVETIFDLQVERVWDDSLPTAKILSGIFFEGYDPGMTSESRKRALDRMLEL